MHMSATLLLLEAEESAKMSRKAESDSFMISFRTYCRRFLLTLLISAETLHGVDAPCSAATSRCSAAVYKTSDERNAPFTNVQWVVRKDGFPLL